jgi:hypothetical protein
MEQTALEIILLHGPWKHHRWDQVPIYLDKKNRIICGPNSQEQMDKLVWNTSRYMWLLSQLQKAFEMLTASIQNFDKLKVLPAN